MKSTFRYIYTIIRSPDVRVVVAIVSRLNGPFQNRIVFHQGTTDQFDVLNAF